MSKAFTKDDDGTPPAVVVPQRAALPQGVVNYVTARGLNALKTESSALEAEEERVRRERGSDGEGRRRALEALTRRRSDLEQRLASAVLIDRHTGSPDDIRFGAQVTVRAADGSTRHYEIVGVDEADASAGRIAFVAPLARALLGQRVGDVAIVRTPRGQDELQILTVSYQG